MSSSGLASDSCEGGSHEVLELIPCGGMHSLRKKTVGWGDTPRVNSNKGEGCDHELSVWPLRLDGWEYDQLKEQIRWRASDELVMKLLSLRCL